MARMRPVRYYYSPKCPAPDCTEAAWKRTGKCRGKSREEAVGKLKYHLHMSKLHYMSKVDAEEMAEAYEWETHDSEEEDVPDPRQG